MFGSHASSSPVKDFPSITWLTLRLREFTLRMPSSSWGGTSSSGSHLASSTSCRWGERDGYVCHADVQLYFFYVSMRRRFFFTSIFMVKPFSVTLLEKPVVSGTVSNWKGERVRPKVTTKTPKVHGLCSTVFTRAYWLLLHLLFKWRRPTAIYGIIIVPGHKLSFLIADIVFCTQRPNWHSAMKHMYKSTVIWLGLCTVDFNYPTIGNKTRKMHTVHFQKKTQHD